MNSSYEKNNYAEVFRNMIHAFKPLVVVELGVLHGYSTMAIAKALQEVNRGTITSYDLFEDYQYNHGVLAEVTDRLTKAGLTNWKLHKYDAWKVADLYLDGCVDFLHVDLSNDGDILRKIMEQWDSKLAQGAVICFEGGSAERDQVEWMIKYNRRPIKQELEENELIKEKYIFGTYLKFPGLTVLLKKR